MEKREARRSERLPGGLKEEQKQPLHSKVLPGGSQVLMGLTAASIPILTVWGRRQSLRRTDWARGGQPAVSASM